MGGGPLGFAYMRPRESRAHEAQYDFGYDSVETCECGCRPVPDDREEWLFAVDWHKQQRDKEDSG